MTHDKTVIAAPMPIERHPFEPFLPDGCRVLMLGSFPPSAKRWKMRFFYPNFTNDMWRILGICHYSDKSRFVDERSKTYRLDDIKDFLTSQRIGMYDTACAVRRLKNTASDKDLEIVEPTDLKSMVQSLPRLTDIVATGQKAAQVLCDTFDIGRPPVTGGCVTFDFDGRACRLWRMPSSSRAYPMRLEDKAAVYQRVFEVLRDGTPEPLPSEATAAWESRERRDDAHKNEV